MQKAIEKGHVLTVTLAKQYSRDRDNPSIQQQCLYVYYYNGKKYRYTVFADYPPEEIKLYYRKNPRKAAMANAIDWKETNWFLRFVIIASMIIFVAKVLL